MCGKSGKPGDTLLKIYARLNTAQNLVTGNEYAAEQLKLLVEQFVNALIRRVILVHEVDDDHVMLLAISVAAPDSLLAASRVPRQIVVHHLEQICRLIPSAAACVAIMILARSRKYSTMAARVSAVRVPVTISVPSYLAFPSA